MKGPRAIDPLLLWLLLIFGFALTLVALELGAGPDCETETGKAGVGAPAFVMRRTNKTL